MKIPFVDLALQYKLIKEEIDQAIFSTLNDAIFIGGPSVKSFEKQFAELYGVNHCISLANGTDAIYITLKMLGIGPGDEVITVANSWISTSETISQTGAKPIFVDIHPDTYTIDPALIENAITAQTKAIIPVHLYGQAAQITEIKELCVRYGLRLIEDCAQSHLTRDQEKLVGTFGDAGTFSFYPGKNIGAYGDAGAVITNDDELAVKIRMFANHGALVKHEHEIEGVNSRMDSIQAAILNVKLKYIEKWTERRIRNAALYTQQLKEIDQLSTPIIRMDTKHTFHLYVIRTSDRDDLKKHLDKNGIQTAIHYPRILPNLPAYQYLNYTLNDFPVANEYEKQILSLPMYPELSEDQIAYVCQHIRAFFKL